jgi:hypothetical protein
VAPLPNGVPSPSTGDHNVGMARLVWAATTIGTTPFGPRLHAGRALEVQWRAAMIRAAIEPYGGILGRSLRYSRLDPSEKGAVSFFLGQAQAKVFAHDFFRVSRFVHYDSYLVHLGRPRRKTRPDFIGFFGTHVAIGVEAKGRSLGYTSALISKAKTQARSLPVIAGHPASSTYVHVACFDYDHWCAYLEDPPRQRRVPIVDPAILTLVYYLPIVNAVRVRDPHAVDLDEADVSYLRAFFPEADLYISVRADIAELVPTDEERTARADDGQKTAALYDLVLRLDEEQLELDNAPTPPENSRVFVGADGVSVELGSSWNV